MRQVILDTETTGLTVEDGHRIIEIGCLEIVNRRVTGRSFHTYVNPQRPIDEGAKAVHGITEERLRDEPRFEQVVQELLGFVAGAEVLIHNAAFDEGFLDSELARLDRGRFRDHVAGVVDTLAMARQLHPGRRNSLDALCERYGVSNAHRTLHGALLDAQLLAEVFLAMTRGQETLQMGSTAAFSSTTAGEGLADEADWPPAALVVVRADEAELQRHAQLLGGIEKEIKRAALWTRLAAAQVGESAPPTQP
jgi:DNA polymerase III subunit epsilon